MAHLVTMATKRKKQDIEDHLPRRFRLLQTFDANCGSLHALRRVLGFLAGRRSRSRTQRKFVAMSAGVILLLALHGYAKVQVNRQMTPGAKRFLQRGWAIQSSALIKEKGDTLSQNTFRPTVKWYPAAVPSTVVGTLVEDKIYPDPFFGMNLRLIPGCTYPIGENFSNLPMPEDSPAGRQ